MLARKVVPRGPAGSIEGFLLLCSQDEILKAFCVVIKFFRLHSNGGKYYVPDL